VKQTQACGLCAYVAAVYDRGPSVAAAIPGGRNAYWLFAAGDSDSYNIQGADKHRAGPATNLETHPFQRL
jgi:hypothetical protein